MIRAVFTHPALLIPATLVAFALVCGEVAVLHPGWPLLLGGTSVVATAAKIGSGFAGTDDVAIADQIGPLTIATLQLLLLATILAMLWRLVRNPVRLWRIRHRGGHLLLMGDQSLAPIVAGEARMGNPAIVLTRQAPARWVHWIHERGSPHLSQDQLSQDQRGGLGRYLRRARLVLIAGPSDDDNIRVADAVLRERDALAARTIALPLVVRVDDIGRHDETERTLAVSGRTDTVHVRLVSLPALIARALLRGNLIDRVERVGSPRRVVVIVGLTLVTERYVLDLMVGAHFGDGRDPLVVIIDPDPATREATFTTRWPFARALGLPVFMAGDVTDPAAVTDAVMRAGARHGLPAIVLVDLAEETTAVAVMTAIDRAMEQRDEVAPLYAVHAAPAALSPISIPAVPFGGADVARYGELLLYERQEAIARAVHEFALEGLLEEGEALGSRPEANGWDTLPESIRDDHRLLVDLYLLKLRDIGARIVPGRQASSLFEPDELDELVRAEHRRRAAARRSSGRSAIAGGEDIEAPEASTPAGPSRREREQIGIINRLLARAGQRVVRDLLVLIEPGYHGDVASAIDDLTRSYPDRVPVFLGAFADPAVRAALHAVHALGHPIQIAMGQHIDTIASALPLREAAQCRTLAATAERIFALPRGADGQTLLADRAHHRLIAPSPGRPAARRVAAAFA